jgi:porin
MNSIESPLATPGWARRTRRLLACAGCGLAAFGTLALGTSAQAQTADASTYDFWTSPNLLGDWSGLRTRLHNDGIDFQLNNVTEVVGNASGGTKQRVDTAGQFVFGATFDLQQIAGLQGAKFQMTVVDRYGRDLASDTGINSLQLVNEVFGRGDIARLDQFWYDQQFYGGLVDFKVGRVTVAEDFFTFSCDFVNLTFCGGAPGNIVGNYIFNFPVSQYGGRLKMNLPDFGYVEVGAYDINPAYLDKQADIALAPTFPGGSTGVMVPVEIGWKPHFGNLAGSYAIGAWYDTSQAPDVFLDIHGQPLALSGLTGQTDTGRYGGYVEVKQQLTADTRGGDPSRGLTGFFNLTLADDRTSTQDRQIAAGLLYHGLFDTRPSDDIGFAVGATHVNGRVAQGEAIANANGVGPGFVQGDEKPLEVFYNYQATGWLVVKPDLQYVIDPGGISSASNAVILGARFTTTF